MLSLRRSLRPKFGIVVQSLKSYSALSQIAERSIKNEIPNSVSYQGQSPQPTLTHKYDLDIDFVQEEEVRNIPNWMAVLSAEV